MGDAVPPGLDVDDPPGLDVDDPPELDVELSGFPCELGPFVLSSTRKPIPSG